MTEKELFFTDLDGNDHDRQLHEELLNNSQAELRSCMVSMNNAIFDDNLSPLEAKTIYGISDTDLKSDLYMSIVQERIKQNIKVYLPYAYNDDALDSSQRSEILVFPQSLVGRERVCQASQQKLIADIGSSNHHAIQESELVNQLSNIISDSPRNGRVLLCLLSTDIEKTIRIMSALPAETKLIAKENSGKQSQFLDMRVEANWTTHSTHNPSNLFVVTPQNPSPPGVRLHRISNLSNLSVRRPSKVKRISRHANQKSRSKKHSSRFSPINPLKQE